VIKNNLICGTCFSVQESEGWSFCRSCNSPSGDSGAIQIRRNNMLIDSLLNSLDSSHYENKLLSDHISDISIKLNSAVSQNDDNADSIKELSSEVEELSSNMKKVVQDSKELVATLSRERDEALTCVTGSHIKQRVFDIFSSNTEYNKAPKNKSEVEKRKKARLRILDELIGYVNICGLTWAYDSGDIVPDDADLKSDFLKSLIKSVEDAKV